MSKYCKKCGTELADNVTFCHICGAYADEGDSFTDDYGSSSNYQNIPQTPTRPAPDRSSWDNPRQQYPPQQYPKQQYPQHQYPQQQYPQQYSQQQYPGQNNIAAAKRESPVFIVLIIILSVLLMIQIIVSCVWFPGFINGLKSSVSQVSAICTTL